MTKTILLSVLMGAMPLSLMAQNDDLYFTPKKSAEIANSGQDKVAERPTYYAGSNRSIDEYNRRGKYWSHYQKIGTDEKGNDIIEFKRGQGVYPDSAYIDTTFVGKYYDTIVDGDDYAYSRSMSRWDGFYNPWFYSARWGFGSYWGRGWYDPWYYGYAGWYDPWYDPWYYDYGYYGWGRPYHGYYGWGYPYYGGRYGWGYPDYWGGGYIVRHRTGAEGYTGARTWEGPGRNFGNGSSGLYSGRTNTYSGRSDRNRSFGGRTGASSQSTDNSFNRSFGSTRSYTPSTPSSAPSHQGGFGGGSFGGGFSGGGFSGSSYGGGGGGGHFGNGRR